MRDLSIKGHLALLFCLLVNLYVGWTVYDVLLDNDAGDSDDHIWLRDASERDTLGEIFDPMLATGNESMDGSYLPIQSFLYHVSVNVLGPRLIPARVFGLWFHMINCCLVLLLAFRFTGSIPAAHLASLLFLFHPRNSAAVGWLCAAVAHGLVLVFYLTAFLVLQSFLHRRAWWRLVLGTLLFMLAALTKEAAPTLFALVVMYDVFVATGLGKLWPPRLRTWLGLVARHAPLFLVVVAALVVQRLKYEHSFVGSTWGGIEIGARSPLRIVELLTMLFHWETWWPRESVMWGMAGVAVALFAGLYLTRRKPELFFLILVLPVMMTPFAISNFRDGQTLGRYLYEVIAIGSVLVATLGVRLARRWPALTWPLLATSAVVLYDMVEYAQRTLT